MRMRDSLRRADILFFTVVLTELLNVSCVSLAPTDASELIGKAGPSFSLTAIDGEAVKLSDFRGDVVVLDFWATWCSSCQKSLPHLEKLSEDAGMSRRGLRVVAVDCGEDEKRARRYLESHKISLRVVEDDGSLQRGYGVRVLPVTVVIGRDGVVRDVVSPSAEAGNEAEYLASEAQLDGSIDGALGR